MKHLLLILLLVSTSMEFAHAGKEDRAARRAERKRKKEEKKARKKAECDAKSATHEWNGRRCKKKKIKGYKLSSKKCKSKKFTATKAGNGKYFTDKSACIAALTQKCAGKKNREMQGEKCVKKKKKKGWKLTKRKCKKKKMRDDKIDNVKYFGPNDKSSCIAALKKACEASGKQMQGDKCKKKKKQKGWKLTKRKCKKKKVRENQIDNKTIFGPNDKALCVAALKKTCEASGKQMQGEKCKKKKKQKGWKLGKNKCKKKKLREDQIDNLKFFGPNDKALCQEALKKACEASGKQMKNGKCKKKKKVKGWKLTKNKCKKKKMKESDADNKTLFLAKDKSLCIMELKKVCEKAGLKTQGTKCKGKLKKLINKNMDKIESYGKTGFNAAKGMVQKGEAQGMGMSGAGHEAKKPSTFDELDKQNSQGYKDNGVRVNGGRTQADKQMNSYQNNNSEYTKRDKEINDEYIKDFRALEQQAARKGCYKPGTYVGKSERKKALVKCIGRGGLREIDRKYKRAKKQNEQMQKQRMR